MKIGIDIDGVLNSQYDFCIHYGSKFCNELGMQYKLENLNVFDTTDMFLWNNEIAHKFWNKYRKKLVLDLPAKPFAAEVIEKLKNENNEIYIITARKNNDEWFPTELHGKIEEITQGWLNSNNIVYDKIYFDITNKGTFCKNDNIDIMIDDEPRNIQNLIGNTNVIIFDTPYNRKKEFNHILRAYSWYDLYYKITNFEVIKNDICNN